MTRELTVEEKIEQLRRIRNMELLTYFLVTLLFFVFIPGASWVFYDKYHASAAPIVETKAPPEPVPKVEPEPEPKLSVPSGVPFSVESVSLINMGNKTQYLLVNLKGIDEEKIRINLFIRTDRTKKCRYEYYGAEYNHHTYFSEWGYLKNSIKGRLVWFGEDAIGITLKSYDAIKHIIIEDFNEREITIKDRKVLCVIIKPENLNWLSVVSK